MAEAEQVKVCPHCAETIKAAAKVCPHCRYWQKKWSLNNPKVVAIFIAVVMTGYCIGMGVFVEDIFGPKNDFAEFRNQITVINSEVSHQVRSSNTWVTVVGMATNQSETSWKNVGVEAQFFDKEGKMIDAITADGDYRGFTILPHGEAAFKIEGKATTPESQYVSHKVFVRTAKDTRERF
jgi:hypothetical protein